MLSFLPPFVLGVLVTSFFILNTLVWAVPVYAVVLIKLLPISPLRRLSTLLMHALCKAWMVCNTSFAEGVHKRSWVVRGTEHLSTDAQYIIVANHQSWNDIYVLMAAIGMRVPFFKFFIKQELIWVPVLGGIWWALDYPFMQRPSKEQLAKDPSLAGKDMETAKRSCAKYRGMPVSVLNFAEGTRFTEAKHRKQQSPYQHLLRPKTGGLAFSAAALGSEVNTLLDITIVYPTGACEFWDFMCGRMDAVVVDIKKREIPPTWFTSDYQKDPDFRREAQDFVAEVWREKDALIEQVLDQAPHV